MFRILGFLIGSAASIGAMLLFLGVPEFHLSKPQLDQGHFDAALEKLREKSRKIEIVARETVAEPAATAAEVGEATPATVSPAARETAPVAAGDNEIGAPVATELSAQEMHWQSFWDPFHSKIAADGFVAQLEKVTGLDYRVMKLQRGTYEVAFAYANDGDRQARLSQISAATGLELAGL